MGSSFSLQSRRQDDGTAMSVLVIINSVIAVIALAGFGVVIARLDRLEGRQKRWFANLERATAVPAASAHLNSLLAAPRYDDPRCLTRYGAKTYSQNDEDGIIEEIFRRIGESSRRFVEIGVGDGTENNTLALLLKGWRGTWIDAAPRNAESIRRRFAPMLQEGQLQFFERRVTLAALPHLLAEIDAVEPIDLLGIDIDGNDYHILAAMPLKARVIVLEYNARFRPPIEWVLPYDESHMWDTTDRFGASLASYARLLQGKGYSLVGCNITGVNAFFIRDDDADEARFLEPGDVAAHYEPARYWLMHAFTTAHPPNFIAGAR